MSQLTAEALQQLQLQFLLNRIQGDGLRDTIAREAAAFYAWGDSTTINSIIDAEKLKGHISRLVKTIPMSGELRTIIVNAIITAVESDLNDAANLQTIVPKKEYDKAISHYAKFEKVRMDIVRLILESPIYSTLISDVLYHGIKDYIVTENPLVKNVPGVSSLMKLGAKGLNKAMPKLEETAETTIKKFINANLRSSVDLSERILNNALSENNIRTIADHFWGTLSEKEFARAKKYVEEDKINESAQLVEDFWQEIRETEYLHNMIHQIVDYVFEQFGERNLSELAGSLGYDQSFVVPELQKMLPDLLERDAVKTLAEERIKATLADFYSSPEAQALFAGN